MAIRAWAGEYDQRVQIYTNSATVNTDGQKIESESLWCRRWASVQPVRGQERPVADQQQLDVTHLVRMRSDNRTRAIQPEYWLKLSDGTRLDVRRIYDLGLKRQELELECNQRA